MAGFIPYIYKDGSADAWQYPEAAAATYHIGDALKTSSGKVTKATANDLPEYICMAEKVCAAGDELPCIPVSESTEYEVELTAAVTAAVPGAVVAISSDSASLAAVASGTGSVRVVSGEGTAKGDKVIVRFK